MKNKITFLIACFAVILLNAQIEIKPGVKAGLNISSFTNLSSSNLDGESLTSFHFGGTASFKFAKFYTLQPELLYSRQGSNIKSTIILFDNSFDPIPNQEIKVQLDYLSIVVNNKFFIAGSGFNVQVAPVIDILLSHKNIDSPEGFDIAIAGGIGYNFPMGLTLDLRYKQGIVDVFGRNVDDGNGAETTSFSDLVLNKTIQLSVGYEFDL